MRYSIKATACWNTPAVSARLTVLAERIKQFAGLLTERRSQDLDTWMTCVDADDLPVVHGFAHGLR